MAITSVRLSPLPSSMTTVRTSRTVCGDVAAGVAAGCMRRGASVRAPATAGSASSEHTQAARAHARGRRNVLASFIVDSLVAVVAAKVGRDALTRIGIY